MAECGSNHWLSQGAGFGHLGSKPWTCNISVRFCVKINSLQLEHLGIYFELSVYSECQENDNCVHNSRWWAPLCPVRVFPRICALPHTFAYLLYSLCVYDLWHAYFDSDIVLWYMPMIQSLMRHICAIFYAFIMPYAFLCLFRPDFRLFGSFWFVISILVAFLPHTLYY